MPIVHMANRLADLPANAANVKGHDHVAAGDVDPQTIGPCPYWTFESHIGLCLFEREHNGYDDSDFYMTVWNPEKQAPESFCFASTRGWSYPCYGSHPDATEDVKAAYDAYLRQQEADAREHARKREAMTPSTGRRVRITAAVRGKAKVDAGETGTVFWFGANTFANRYGSRYLTPMQRSIGRDLHAVYGDPRDGMRCGVQLDRDGRKVFLNAQKVEVIEEALAA
jgi:hypothetical protein